ncbi:MAG: hypothetical protein Q9160_003656 [Pyrenula sp. 1 TL-2023]
MVLRKWNCCSSGSQLPASAHSVNGNGHDETLSARIISLKDREIASPASRSSVPCPRDRQQSTSTNPHLLDEKVPNLLQTPPINVVWRTGESNESDHYSDVSSAVSIRGPRIVSLISTDTGASRLSTRTEQEIRQSSIDDNRPPPPYTRAPPQQSEQRCRASSIGTRHRRVQIHQNEFSDYVQQLRQRIEPKRLPSPTPSYLNHQQSEAVRYIRPGSPNTPPCTQHVDFGQESLESEQPVSSRSPSPPNAPLLSRITTPSTFATMSDRDEDFSPADLMEEDPPLFPPRRGRTPSTGSHSMRQTSLEEAQEGLFEELDRRMRFEAWRIQEQREE